ncbi:MAG TPA: glycosyltransferase [Candidatus Sulfotelmatobacter sp.]|nr:glycosyltransferase [Candidatus Sulfotelmatobacter sp.]
MSALESGPVSQRPLHVLTLTPFYPSEKDEADGCFVSEPVEALARIGVANTVFAVQPFYRKKLRALTSAIPVHWLRYFSLPGGVGLPWAGAFLFASIVSRIRDLKTSGQVDIIHAHGALPCGHATMLLGEELQIPYVVTVHGLDAFSTRQVTGRPAEWCRRISQRVYRSSGRVICISERVREAVLEATGKGCRTSVVYNGTNTELFSPEPELTSEEVTVLSVANLIRIKGHETLIRAVAAIAADFPKLTLQIIGDGPEGPRLRSLAQELGLSDRVQFLGRRSREQVAAAMRRSTVFALPSSYEGLGCVYLEAMATGKPVIGCRGQGIAEIIQHGTNGFLVGPDNERELALALSMLLRDEKLRRLLGTTARETILERLTLADQAQNLARIFRETAR